MIEFPPGSRQDIASRHLQGAASGHPEWCLNYGSLNIPLDAQRYYGCDLIKCPGGLFHYCDRASVVYFDTFGGGEWTWHVIAGGFGIERPDPTKYDNPQAAIEAAEAGMAARSGAAAS